MAGPYHYGQQTYGNTAESLLSGLAPDAQVALANTLLSTILQGQAPGSNPSYGMYQQSQSYQEMNYRDNRGYRNETVQRGQRYGVNRQGDRIGRRDDRNDRRGAPPRSGYLSGMDRKKGGRDQGFRNKAGNKGPKKPVTQSDKQQKDKKKVAKEPEKIDDKVNEEAEKDRAESPNEKTEEAEKKESDEEKMEEGETDVKKEELNEKEESEKLKDTTEYAGIPKEFLYCHICEKHVWNGVSFLRHIRGNKHLSLVRRLEDVYEATVKSLRLISQLDEYRRIGMEGSKGVFKKKNRRPWKVTCDMCDVSFFW
ncbi:zinc finger protein on ecdysone puffs-like [Artemia franciscana]|uniref:zinc finger protein on ecdysone puffs-like n=1 Tax=Artemia franciscana TaxID=6661 RepID=UPI0032DA917C